jgi:cyclic lactone autoinducer peptide
MRAKIYRFISKHGSILCALAILVAPIACEQCRVLFYEPVEPKGLDWSYVKI